VVVSMASACPTARAVAMLARSSRRAHMGAAKRRSTKRTRRCVSWTAH
jgi:hypothetical protein